MPCPICGSDSTDYQCNSCKRNICFTCARTVGKSVMCVQCLKVSENKKQQPKEKSTLKSAFISTLIITIGLAVILFFGDYVIFNMLSDYSNILPDGIKSLVDTLRGTSFIIVGSSAAITVLLFILYKIKGTHKTQPVTPADKPQHT